jgi:hypothetical protein
VQLLVYLFLSHYKVIGLSVTNELERMDRKLSWPNLRFYVGESESTHNVLLILFC